MPFITQGKTNIKYLLIVIILAVLVGGGILGYQYWWLPKKEAKMPEVKLPEVKVPELPPEMILKGETTDWQIYRNNKYGFELKYPDYFKVSFLDENEYSPAIGGPGVITAIILHDSYSHNYDPYSNTNLREASLVIGLKRDKESLANCLEITNYGLIEEEISEFSEMGLLEKIEINGVTFYRNLGWEGAAGTYYETINYNTIHKDICYIAVLFIKSGNIGAMPETTSEFNKDEVIDELKQVLSTFRFLD